jgi:4-aminobutyrate aminotransferase-like enzyme
MDTREKYEKYVNTAFLPAVDPLVIDRADGATYFGADGSSFIDCFAGISVVNTGHANEKVIAAARQQMERLVHCSSYLYHVEVVANLADQAAEKGERLMQALCDIKPKSATVGEIRGRGLMIGIEMVENDQSKAPAAEDAKRIKAAVRDRGVLIGVGGVYGNVLRIQPPLTISDEELDTVLAAVTEVLEA